MPELIKMSTFVNHPEASVSNLSVEKVPMLRDEKQQPANVQVQEVATPDEPTPQLLPTRRTVYLSEHREQDRRLPLDQFFHACTQQTPFVRALILTAITAIPFVVFILVAHYALPKRAVGPADAQATIFELAKWLLISWATFMGLLWCGRIFAAISTWCCAQSRSLIKFQRLAEAICLRMVLMLWAAVCYAVIPSVFHHSVTTEAKGVATVTNWVATLQKAFKFLIIAFAIILVQGIVLELASIQYIGVYMGPRSQKAAKELDTIKRLYQLTNPHESTGLGMFAKAMRKLLQPINDNDLYYQISRGQGDTEIWTQYANHLWDCIAQGKSSLTHFDLDRQLRAMNRDPARAHDLFTQLDDSCDGEVTLDEVEKLVQRVGLQLNIRGESQRSINSLLRKLEVLLSIVMLGVIFVLYSKSTPTPRTPKNNPLTSHSRILPIKIRSRPQSLLDRHNRSIIRLRRRPPRIRQRLCLRLRQTPLRRRRLHRVQEQKARRHQDLPHPYQFRRSH